MVVLAGIRKAEMEVHGIEERNLWQRHTVMAAAIAYVEAHRHDIEKLLGLEVLAVELYNLPRELR